MASWVLVPCERSRIDELERLLCTLLVGAENVVIVTTLPDPIPSWEIGEFAEHIVLFEEPGKLFGAWCNAGFDYIASLESGPYEVCCIGSSHTGSPHTIDVLRACLRQYCLTMVGPDLSGELGALQVTSLTESRRTQGLRVPCECFMVAGELRLRFDPEFRWYYSDDDLEMQARQLGTVGLVGGTGFIASSGHELSDEQALHAAEDREKFIAKWGAEFLPW